VDYDQNSTQGISSKRYEPGLTFRIRILDRAAEWIPERLLGMGKADAVFAQV